MRSLLLFFIAVFLSFSNLYAKLCPGWFDTTQDGKGWTMSNMRVDNNAVIGGVLGSTSPFRIFTNGKKLAGIIENSYFLFDLKCTDENCNTRISGNIYFYANTHSAVPDYYSVQLQTRDKKSVGFYTCDTKKDE
jgi:hypothetical protein